MDACHEEQKVVTGNPDPLEIPDSPPDTDEAKVQVSIDH